MNDVLKRMLLKTMAAIHSDDSAKVVFYHDVHMNRSYVRTSTPLSTFMSHVSIAKERGYLFVSDISGGSRELLVCFDDGFHGIFECRDFLLGEGILPTVFLAVDLVGKEGYLSWAEILELQEAGFKFESHTWSHRSLTEISYSELEHELLDSKLLLSDKLGKEVSSICFPRGLFSREIYKRSLMYGYKNLFSCIPGNARTHYLPNLICRNIVQSFDADVFLAVIKGGANIFGKYYYKRHCQESNFSV